MKELHRTSNPVEISWLQALMDEHDIHIVVLDGDTSQVYGSALIPRRIMVAEDDLENATRILETAKSNL